MTSKERLAAIGLYRQGHGEILAMLEGLPQSLYDLRRGDAWSVRMIIHHLADTEVFRAARLRQLLTQEKPIIAAIDEIRFVEGMDYQRPIAASLALFDAAVRSSLELLTGMRDADWGKAGTHTEYGHFTMDQWLERAAIHLPEHAAQMRTTLQGG